MSPTLQLFRDNRNPLFLLLLSTLLLILFLSSCRTVRTDYDHNHHSSSADTIIETLRSESTIDESKSRLDSLLHVIHTQDSLISSYAERDRSHTGYSYHETSNLRDSMWMTFDSIGTPSFHYLHLRDRLVETHDTIYRDRLIETDTRRVTNLRDSLSYYRAFIDSLLIYNTYNDSVYQARLDSLSDTTISSTEKRPSPFETFITTLPIILISTSIILLISLAAIKFFRH